LRIKEHANDGNDYDIARKLRRNATPQEQKLWLALRGEAKKSGLKFRRQHVLHPYIVDFCCPRARLVIEVDGYSHDLPHNHDAAREFKIRQMGYHILRFTNEDIDDSIEGVTHVILEKALATIKDKAPTPYPRPRGAGESRRDSGLQN